VVALFYGFFFFGGGRFGGLRPFGGGRFFGLGAGFLDGGCFFGLGAGFLDGGFGAAPLLNFSFIGMSFGQSSLASLW